MLIEAGPERSWPTLKRGLQEVGVDPSELAAVLLTHIHLDHAGAAWRFCDLGVPVYVHEFGMKHLIDPQRLVASATRIYGEDMDRLWGRIEPCRADLVRPAVDGTIVDLAGLRFRAVETPGHAAHHHAWSLEHDNTATCFTGDVAAMLLPGSNWISIPMPPPEFDQETWNYSLDRLDAGHWDRLCLTHGGDLCGRDTISTHLTNLRRDLELQVTVIRDLRNKLQSTGKEATVDLLLPTYHQWLRTAAASNGISADQFSRYVTPGLMRMNLMGVSRYLDQRASAG